MIVAVAAVRSTWCSVTGRRALALGRRDRDHARKLDGERRALAELRITFDRAAVTLDELVDDREAEAGAFADIFGREEWIPDSRQHVARDAGTVVADFDLDRVGGAFGLDRDLRVLATRERLRGVRQEVHEYLVDLTGVTAHATRIAVLLHDVDVALEQVTKQLERIVDRAIEIEVDDGLVVGTRVVVERADDRLGALRAALHDLDHLAHVFGRFAACDRVEIVEGADRFFERTDRVDDRVDRVVDLVRDTGDELTDRRELLGPHELLLRAGQLVERFGELAVLAREIVGAHLDRALEVEVDLFGRAQLVAQLAPHLLERERQPADLVALTARGDRVGELAARHAIGALLEAADRRHELRDREHDDAGARAEQHEEEPDELFERFRDRFTT